MMDPNTTHLLALVFAHVFAKYVDFVEEGTLLRHFVPMYFQSIEIYVFFGHVCKMLTLWLLNRHTCSINTGC